MALSDDVLNYLAKEGYNPQYGARPLKRLIQNKILTPVAKLLISQEVESGGRIDISVKKTNAGVNIAKPTDLSIEFDFIAQKGESSRRRRKSGSSVLVGSEELKSK